MLEIVIDILFLVSVLVIIAGLVLKWMEKRPGGASFHYPSIIEGKDENFHASYSYFIDEPQAGEQKGKSIKHATFNKEWVMAGDQ